MLETMRNVCLNQMIEPFVLHFVLPFLSAKEIASNIGNTGKKQAELPVFKKAYTFNDRMALIYQVSAYMAKNIFYVKDPYLFDNYTHPKVLQFAVNKFISQEAIARNTRGRELTFNEKQTIWNKILNELNISCDCDDYAAWSCAVLNAHGIKKAFMYNLLVEDQIKDIERNHVITLFELGTDDSDRVANPWIGCLDTNGLNWFQLKNGEPNQQIRDFFGKLYGVKYKWLIPVGMPFSDLKVN